MGLSPAFFQESEGKMMTLTWETPLAFHKAVRESDLAGSQTIYNQKLHKFSSTELVMTLVTI